MGGIARQDYLNAQDDVNSYRNQIAVKQQEIQETLQKRLRRQKREQPVSWEDSTRH